MKTKAKDLLNKRLIGERLSVEECIFLYNNSSLAVLCWYADNIKKNLFGKDVFFIENYHIEPTNVCIYKCNFCSFYAKNNNEEWAKSFDEIIDDYKKFSQNINELHIVGGVNSDYNLDFYSKLLLQIKKINPDIFIKAFTATEIHFLSENSNKSYKEVLKILKNSGLDSMPGGGAEIFDENIRKKICPNKISSNQWLEIHKIAHDLKIFSNATMLYGHIENIEQRVAHMEMLRDLQDKTNGFNAFIPLKYKMKNNNLSIQRETTIIEDIKVFAISRLFFDNFEHIKVYWPAYGKEFAQLSINFGVDDIDGTISNSTKIYSMAGAKDNKPEMTKEEATELISNTGNNPVKRDGKYRIAELV